jgi:hypothetical protein
MIEQLIHYDVLFLIAASSSLEGIGFSSGIQDLLTQGSLLARLPREAVAS